MLNQKLRKGWDKLMRPVGRWLARTPLSPDFVTLIGVAIQGYIAYLILGGHLLLAGLMGIVAGLMDTFDGALAKAKGSPIDFIFPAEGLPAVTEPVAILKTTQNAAAARAFVDFILSDEGQKLAVSMGYIPAKAGVGMPAWYPAGVKINLMPTDIPKVVQTNSANLKRFSDLFGN